ncbi:MAG: acyl-CoA transferase, partial [Bacteroidia bacterium]|nr:acyl-CoA transferase [Bacteroidia bacterium]
MMSKREEVLNALFEKLKTLDIQVLRNEVLPQKIPPEGIVFIRDGNMGDPEVLLSPPLY